MREKTGVGYLSALSAEGLLSLGPDLVVAVDGAGPPDVLTPVREAGARIEIIWEPPNPEGVLDEIAVIGRLVRPEREAGILADEVRVRFAAHATRSDRRWGATRRSRLPSKCCACIGSGCP